MVWRLMLLGSIALHTGDARAQAAPAAPAPAVDKAKAKVAKQYVDAGLAAQSSGDYDTAITFYSKAYQLVPHPVLIFNMAQAHRLAGRMAEALRLYAQYLEKDPGGAQAQTARDFLAEDVARKAEVARKLDEAHKADEARKIDEARKADDARKAEARKTDESRRAREASRAAETQRAAQPTGAAAPVAGASSSSSSSQSEPADVAPGRGLRLGGITTGAVGVVGIAIGIGFGIQGSSLSSEVSKRYDPDKVQAGDRANTLQAVGLIGGSVLVVAGAVLYWRGYVSGHRAEGLAIAPMLSDHVAGLALGGFLP
ncbi:MAG: tetratricopeptide repeat protein [Kofleriaceae bacterium]